LILLILDLRCPAPRSDLLPSAAEARIFVGLSDTAVKPYPDTVCQWPESSFARPDSRRRLSPRDSCAAGFIV
jgi:hypothetical protein